MSYFVVISGEGCCALPIARGIIVPIETAQDYVSSLAGLLTAIDGQPLFFWDDGKTGTSHEIVCEAESEAQMMLCGFEILQACAFSKVLTDSDRLGCRIRVWWANNDPEAFLRVPCAEGALDAAQISNRQVQNGNNIEFVMRPTMC
jgi:hypothetical protein